MTTQAAEEVARTDLRGKVVRGSFLHAPEPDRLESLSDALISIGDDGLIQAVLPAGHAGHERLLASARAADRLVTLTGRAWVIPGLVDLHVHAPQYAQLGQALDVPLEVWLQKYTFPLESRFADLAFATEVYAAVVTDLLAQGTTTALYFATIHQEATHKLVDLCLAHGQRALVGKVAMDDPAACPDYYRDASAEDAVDGARALIDYVRRHPDNTEGLVWPVITPRFIPSCTDAALSGLGSLARETGCHVQTHCSESDWAHGHVLARHGVTDAASLDGFGLLGRRTVLAHANFLTDDDMERVRARGAAVAHCPLSNAYFANAVFPLRRALEKGLHVGLGTDISGGHAASLFDTARMAIAASRMLETGVDPDRPADQRGSPASRIDVITAFHLATAGGGRALDLPIGRFEPGCWFDALLIDCEAANGSIRLFGEVSPEDLAGKILLNASRANIAQVWVGGRRVAGAA